MARNANPVQLTEEDVQLMEKFTKVLAGNEVNDMVRFREFLATPSAQMLIPKVIIGAMREAAEPLYIASKLLKRVRLETGSIMVFPSIGIMRAYDVAEGQEIPEETIDWQLHETTEIRIGKSGLRIRVSDEMVADSQWDIVAMLIEQAGRAMARHKEQKCFNAFSKHGHIVFDPNLDATGKGVAAGGTIPACWPTGLDWDGKYNGTLSAEDFLDMSMALMNNEMTPTDVLLHPLTWSVFAKNELHSLIAGNPYSVYPANSQPSNIAMGPASIQGRLPFSFNVQLSPFIPIDKVNKTFDMYVVDRNNIGVLLVRDDLKTENFDDPARDIQNIKTVERYGVGILNEGRGIAVARNIAMVPSFNLPIRTKTV